MYFFLCHALYSIDPTKTKDIIMFAEDTRIALRKSEIMSQIQDQAEQTRQLKGRVQYKTIFYRKTA